MKLAIPLVGLLVGTGSGIGAGLYLAPEETSEAAAPATAETAAVEEVSPDGEGADIAIVNFNNQFIVPVLAEDRVRSLVVLTLALEAVAADTEVIYAREAKMRDIFLQVLFEHANLGGFSGAFTNGHNLKLLRQSLYEAARNEMGPRIRGVLITDLSRQDL